MSKVFDDFYFRAIKVLETTAKETGYEAEFLVSVLDEMLEDGESPIDAVSHIVGVALEGDF